MKKIGTIGSAMYDIFISYDAPALVTLDHTRLLTIPAGKKIEVTGLSHHSGGGSTNTAVAFKRLGLDASAFFKIGTDDAGEFIKHDLQTTKVSIDHIIETEEEATGTSFVIPSPDGNHAILTARGANLTLTADDIPWDMIRNLDYLYVTALSGNTAHLLPLIAQKAHASNVPVATNPGTSQLVKGAQYLKEALKYIDTLIVNAYEAQLLFSSLACDKILSAQPYAIDAQAPLLMQKWFTINQQNYTIQHFFHHVLRCGPRIVVVTNGKEGVYVATKERILFHPSLETEVVSTVGAGDAFASTFVGSLLLGKNIEEAIRFGILNSTSVLHYAGAKTGLLTRQELENRLSMVPEQLLLSFIW